MLGGTQSLHTNSRDEALALPTEESARIALRTQQIIAYESGVADTVDPFGGSYYIESLTDELERRILDYLRVIDHMGGAVRAIEQGYMQREIHQAAYETQRAIERKDEIVVGVNAFTVDNEETPELLRVDDRIEREAKANLQALKTSRDGQAVKLALGALKRAAEGQDNLMPFILDAVRKYASLGEISNVLREVFGEYQPV